jgi:hypothetical protein
MGGKEKGTWTMTDRNHWPGQQCSMFGKEAISRKLEHAKFMMRARSQFVLINEFQ